MMLVRRSGRKGIESLDWAGFMSQYQRALDTITQNSAQIRRAIMIAQESANRAIAAIAQAQAGDERNRRYARAMLVLGWPPVLDIYTTQVSEILERFDSDAPEALAQEVSQFLVEFFSPELLRQKVAKWKELHWVQKRIGIVEKAVEAHIRGDFELSVPTMLAQIEGVVASGFAYVGFMRVADLKKLHDKLLGQSGRATDAGFKQYIDAVLLVPFEHGHALGSQLSRHAILHGADTEYGTPQNSLRTILLFDYLVESFRFVALEGSSVFHAPGCRHAMSSRHPRQVFRDSDEGLRAGLRPCAHCQPESVY
jgi:Metal binding domain of Ada